MNVYPLKCRIRAEAAVTRVDVYDDIGEGGWFSDGLTAKSFAAQLAGVKGALEVHINSGGGDVFDGIAIGNAIRGHTGPVTTVTDGIAASIASVIAQAGGDGKRIIEPGAMMMIHDAFGLCQGDAADMGKMAQRLGDVSDNIAGIYAARSGQPADEWRAAMLRETWYTAEEAVAAGLADRVGGGKAVLPDGLDLAAYTSLPGRIAAALRSLPVAAAPAAGGPAQLTEAQIRAVVRDEIHVANAAADESSWDASRAWSAGAASDDPAAFYNAICAGKNAGDPATQAAHALPHHYHPGDPPNRHGVSAALGRIGSTQGLTNESAARSHLEGHESAMGSGGGGDSGGGSNQADGGFAEEDPGFFESIRKALKGAAR